MKRLKEGGRVPLRELLRARNESEAAMWAHADACRNCEGRADNPLFVMERCKTGAPLFRAWEVARAAVNEWRQDSAFRRGIDTPPWAVGRGSR
jgi:hypothetical protein